MKPFKFEKLEVWNVSLCYHELIYEICNALPKTEQYNLEDQLKRAATSVCLNIAEGSTGQSNSEQKRFLSYAIRSSIETIAIIRLIQRYYPEIKKEQIEQCNMQCHLLLRKLQAFRNYLKKKQ